MTSQEIAIIAQERLQGLTYKELAKIHNIHASNICRALNRDEIKEILETGMQQQIALVPLAVNVLHDTAMQTEDKALRLKASETILKNTGLSPNQTTSITLTQILNVHAQEIPESVRRIIQGIQANDTPPAIGADSEVIDV